MYNKQVYRFLVCDFFLYKFVKREIVVQREILPQVYLQITLRQGPPLPTRRGNLADCSVNYLEIIRRIGWSGDHLGYHHHHPAQWWPAQCYHP